MSDLISKTGWQNYIYKGKVDGLFYIIVGDDDEEGYVKAKRISDRYNYIVPFKDLEVWMPIPTIQPKSKIGKWVNEQWDGVHLIGVTCSHCMVVESRFSDFCPNCGADMRG